jgi:hypothetical protein
MNMPLLVSPYPSIDQAGVGEYLVIPITAITETKQRTEDKIWQVKKSKRESFITMITALLTTILEDAFDVAFHSGGTVLAERGFGTGTPPEILSRFQQNYGKPGYQEIKAALLRQPQPAHEPHATDRSYAALDRGGPNVPLGQPR